MAVTTVYDCTGANLGKFSTPAGVILAGYDTGSNGVPWTAEQWAAHPNAVHIDQDWNASDYKSDILDVEAGAATPQKASQWYQRTLVNYQKGERPGQRHPSIYASASNLTPIANALIADGVKSGPGLWVANWNLSDPQAVSDVQNASGPFPIIGVQFHNFGPYDVSVFSTTWLNTVSKKPVVPTPSPPVNTVPTKGNQPHWHWCRKCQGLFYDIHSAGQADYPSADHCPAGGSHLTGNAYNYILPYEVP